MAASNNAATNAKDQQCERSPACIVTQKNKGITTVQMINAIETTNTNNTNKKPPIINKVTNNF